jgi:predicted transglutaminase-like cysteine proteinase
LLFFFLSAVIKANGPIVFTQALFDTIRASYGDSAQKRVQDWQEVIQDNEDESLDEQLYNVNLSFNQVEFVDDIKHWKKTDYWATPIEFHSTNAGDCEDFNIAKYFILGSSGRPSI